MDLDDLKKIQEVLVAARELAYIINQAQSVDSVPGKDFGVKGPSQHIPITTRNS